MSDLQEWFKTELHGLGFAGLEGVYDYLASMSDAQAKEYLESLLGSDPSIQIFANTYTERRGLRSPQETARSPSTPNPTEVNNKDEVELSKNSKRGKKKGRASASNSSRQVGSKPSFARAVSYQTSSAPNSKQAQAIKDAPVEQVRQKVREYRRTKQPINCLRCGKIEQPIQEDGSCSFCCAPIFPVRPDELPEPKASRNSDRRSGAGPSNAARRIRSKPVEVLGRYACRPERKRDEFESCAKLVDIAGNAPPGYIVEGNGRRDLDPPVNQEVTQRGLYADPTFSGEEKSGSEERLREALETELLSEESGVQHLLVHGRVVVDDISPSVCLDIDG